MGNTYPAHPPLINVNGADVLTPAQVSPWMPPTGYNTNFFSGRIYDPQAIYTDRSTVTIVFAGYNTPQPSSNLADYRTIGRFQVRFPAGYLASSVLRRVRVREYVYPARAHLHHAAGVKQLLRWSAPTPPSPRHVTR